MFSAAEVVEQLLKGQKKTHEIINETDKKLSKGQKTCEIITEVVQRTKNLRNNY